MSIWTSLTTMIPAHDFPQFPTLSLELRLKIWSHAVPDARTVPVRFSRKHRRYMTTRAAAARSLALLWACAESRGVGLRRYTLLRLAPAYDSTIYIDLDRDAPFFDHEDCSPAGDLTLDLQKSPQSALLRRVAFDTTLWEILRVFRFDPISEIGELPGLQEMALVLQTKKLKRATVEEQAEAEAAEAADRLARPRDARVRADPARDESLDEDSSENYMHALMSEVRHADYWIELSRSGVWNHAERWQKQDVQDLEGEATPPSRMKDLPVAQLWIW